MKNHYKILGINKTATNDDIKKAYRKLILKYHPDKNRTKNAKRKTRQLNKAYTILSNRNLRARYDHGIKINSAELKTVGIFGQKIFSKYNFEEIIGDEEVKFEGIFNDFIKFFYSDPNELITCLKQKRYDEIAETLHTKVKIYMKKTTTSKIIIDLLWFSYFLTKLGSNILFHLCLSIFRILFNTAIPREL